MCLIIAAHKASSILSQITEREINNAATRNDDGVGVMYINKDGDMVVEKYTPKTAAESPKVLSDFIIRHIELAGDRPFASHLRMTTHGINSDENTHPHEVISEADGLGRRIWMMHNGVISKYGAKNVHREDDQASWSDTVRFVRHKVRPLLLKHPDLIAMPEFRELLSEHIGNMNKLCFLNDQGQMFLVNSQSGGWREDVWLSTPSYLGYTPPANTYMGGNQHGNNTFRSYRQGSTAGTNGTGTNYSSPITTSHEPLPTYFVEQQTISDALKNAPVTIKSALRSGSMRLKTQPDYKQTAIAEFFHHAVLGVKDWSLEQLERLCKECPADAAEIIYACTQYNIGANLLEGQRPEIKEGIQELCFLNYPETMEYILLDYQLAAELLHLLLSFSYPWMDTYPEKTKQKQSSSSSQSKKKDNGNKEKQLRNHYGSKKHGKNKGGRRHDKHA